MSSDNKKKTKKDPKPRKERKPTTVPKYASEKKGGSNAMGMTAQGVKKLSQRGGLSRIHPVSHRYSYTQNEKMLRRVMFKAASLVYHRHLRSLSVDQIGRSLGYCGMQVHGYVPLDSE